MMRNRVLRVLLYNVASPQKCITDACSFLQGSKSISETLCGMYDLCFYMSHTRRLWNCFKTSMYFLELVHLLYQSLFCLSSKVSFIDKIKDFLPSNSCFRHWLCVHRESKLVICNRYRQAQLHIEYDRSIDRNGNALSDRARFLSLKLRACS